MMGLRERLGLAVGKGLDPGTHMYDGKGDLSGHRFHLRVDTKRSGVLMVDASKLLVLNGTALDYVRGLLEGWDLERTVRYMRSRYRNLDEDTASKHLDRVKSELLEFLSGNQDAVRRTISDTPTIGSDTLPSPYRMDVCLTYRCQNDCAHCYNEEREVEELGRESWIAVIDKLWDIGIPHVVFTGGEPTLSPYLEGLIARSEEHGQITGLISNGRRLGEDGYLSGLISAGLDHVQITILSHRAGVHDRIAGSAGAWEETISGIKTALSQDVYLSTNTTIMEENRGDLEETMRFLISLGVKNLAFNGLIRSGKGRDAKGVSYGELKAILLNLVAIAEEEGVKLVWYTPTPYCELNPVNYGLGIKQCTACSLNMAVEPDGSVLPCQSYYRSLGNILTDPWEGIWNHALCKRLREREYLPERCRECELSDVCGGGCPLALEGGYYMCLDRYSSF
jgi:radical SAM protein with 4Fe4S-binding SPASM domain